MSNYKRIYIPGGTYFFTLVTYRRKPVFAEKSNIAALRHAMQKVQIAKRFHIDAIVILPDHLHSIWRLPENDVDYSGRWREIKKATSREINGRSNRANERPVWQRRFWEHLIQDEEDWRRHMDYIHYNPVKHGLVTRPADWRWSSFQKLVKRGWYEEDWGGVAPPDISGMEFE